jgi:hypothetical protein
MTFASVWWMGEGVRRVPAHAAAFGDRFAPCRVRFDAIWSAPTDDAANVRWAREAWTDMRRYGSGRMYHNFPGHGEGKDLVGSVFGGEATRNSPR